MKPANYTSLINAIQACSPTASDQALSLYQVLIQQCLGADSVTWLAGYRGKLGRDSWKTELLNGWKVVELVYPAEVGDRGAAQAYMQLARSHGIDPMTELALNTAGETRILHKDLIQADWMSHPVKRAFFENANIGERMLGVFNVHPDAESYFLIDRAPGSDPFSDADRELLLELLCLFPRLHYWLFLERGLVPPAQPLSPRYKEITHLLLEDRSKSEIADSLGLSENTTHSYIIDIYKKFKVSSRSQLVGLWLTQLAG